eukprot:Unigene10732_Nuclearia_a/m.32806 Unigene10732_Nuclearia_a/g.32806  ORF Unigene10732_Nuclearia_a/g.32806 Unigene10732_Nuclearia_a/m.32806 type:complete len:157 (+) Unigene10732_Nuclearia_a:53-523(+)
MEGARATQGALRDFLLLLSLRVRKPEDVERIGDALEKSGITQEGLITVSVQTILDRITTSHQEAAAVLHTIADYFFGIDPMGTTRRRRAASGGEDEFDRLTPSKRARILASTVVNSAHGQVVAICRTSFNETFGTAMRCAVLYALLLPLYALLLPR